MNALIYRLFLPLLLVSLALPALAQPQSDIGNRNVNGKSNGNGAISPPAIPALPANGAEALKPTLLPIPKQIPIPVPAPMPAPELPQEPAELPEPAPSAIPAPAPTLSDLGRSLRNYFTEDELSLLFQYMKESVIASFKGEEVNLPPDLSFKLEILLVRMKKESDHYMDNLIDQIERDLKNSLKEKLKESLTPPPIKEQPYNPWLKYPWQ